MASRVASAIQRIILAVILGVVLIAIVFLSVGCQVHDHPNRSAKPIPGDVNLDGVVDEADLEELEALLGLDPDVSDPFPPPCDVNLDGFFNFGDLVSLLARLCHENRCGDNCRGDIPRPHLLCEDD